MITTANPFMENKVKLDKCNMIKKRVREHYFCCKVFFVVFSCNLLESLTLN